MECSQALTFRYSSVAQEILCGPDTIASLCSTLDRLGADTALIVCGPSILHKSNVITRVQNALGQRCVGTFAGVLPHAPVPILEEAVAMARECQPQALVSVGGGSSHDMAKGIATLLGEGGRIYDYETRFTPPNTVVFPDFTQPKMPVIAISTTMGAAELSRGAGFADHTLGRKLVVADPGTIPRAILIDGQALATTPLDILRSTAIGQLRIAVESVYSTRHNPISDALALRAITMLTQALPGCTAHDIDGLLHVKTAACMASLAAVGGLGVNTAVAHHIGALYNVPHGTANAILLPHTMRFNMAACADRQALIAQAMGLDTTGLSVESAALAAAEAVAALCHTLGLPARLRDVDVPQDGLAAIAAATLHDRGLATNPKPIADAAPILEVLHQAW